MSNLITPSGWKLKNPQSMTALGSDAFVIEKNNICSYIEKRSNGWCCYKKFTPYEHMNNHGIQVSIKGTPFKANSIDEALLHLGMSVEEKNEIMKLYYSQYLSYK